MGPVVSHLGKVAEKKPEKIVAFCQTRGGGGVCDRADKNLKAELRKILTGKKAEPRNSGLCPSEGRNPFYPGIFYASAIKNMSQVCFSCSSHHPQEFFCLERRHPFYLGKKAELRKF
jgi:hypothetical protein